jgi:hypothetical protein
MIKPQIMEQGQKVSAVTLSGGSPGVFQHRYERRIYE